MNEIEYLITCLMEECAELIQEGSKAKRFGLNDAYRGDGNTPGTQMQVEFNDILTITQMLEERGLLIFPNPRLQSAKRERLEKMMGYSRDVGRLTKGY